MAEKVGLIAVLEMAQFNSAFKQYTSSLNQMNSQTSATARGIDSSFLSLGDSVNALATKIAVGLVAGLAAAGAAVTAFVASGITQAANLEAQLDSVNAILGITEEQGKAVKDAIVQLGVDPSLKVTASEAAQAVELLARNGLSATEIIGTMSDMSDSAAKAVVLLANATGADFGFAADIATDAMLVFNKEASELTDIVSGIVGVVNSSKFTVQDYSLAIRNGGAAADLMGVSIDAFNTVIAASAEELGTGMRAGTGFANFLNRLTPNTNVATDAMKELGFITADGNNIFFDSTGKLKDMSDVTRILNEVLFQEQTVLAEVGGRTEEQNRILGELTEQYSDAQLKIADYQSGVRGLTLTDEERNKKIEEQQQIMSLLTPKIEELNSVRGDLVTTTNKLTDEERSMALEAIFGRDALATVVALAREGAPAFTDVATAMEELGVSQEEATRIVEEGITAYDLLYEKIGNVDALQQAIQRMDNFKGVMEIISGIIETVQLQIGDAFLPILTRLAEGFREIVEDIGPKVVSFFSDIAGFITQFVNALLDGETPLQAFTDTLKDFGFGNIAEQIDKVVISIDKFITPIVDFVKNNSEAFIGALKGIGVVLASAAIAAKLVKIGIAITSLLTPVGLLIGAAAAIGAAIQTDFAGAGIAFANIVQSVQDGSFTWESAWNEVVTVAQNIWTMIEPSLITLWTNITTWFNGIDWAAVGAVMWNALLTAGGDLWAFVQPHLITLYTNIQTWFVTTDWAAIGQSLWDKLLTAGGNLWDFILPKLQELFTNIQTWFVTTDWATVGQNIYNGLLGTSESLGETIGTWVSTLITLITEFFANTDWVLVGETLINGIGAAIVAVIGALWTYISVFYTFISEFVQSADWWTIASNLVTAIFTALVDLFTGIGNVLIGWYQLFVDWVSTVDWAAVATSIIDFIVTGLSNFASLVSPTLVSWYQSFVDWVTTTDFTQKGIDIVTFILDGLFEFAKLVVDVFASWLKAFVDWVEEIDWYQLGVDIVDFIIYALTEFPKKATETIKQWLEPFNDWVERDWEAEGRKVEEKIILGLAQFVLDVLATLSTWWTAISTWFSTQDWGVLGTKIIDGIIQGLLSGASAIYDAVSGLVSGMSDRWNEDTESHSPSRLFMEKGSELIDGLVIGIMQSASGLRDAMSFTIEGVLDATSEQIRAGIDSLGGAFGSFQGVLAKRYEDTIIKPMEDAQSQLQDKLKGLQNQGKEFNDEVLELQGIISDNQGAGYFKGAFTQVIGGLTKDQKEELKTLKSMRDEAIQSGNLSEANRFISMITRLQEIEASATTIKIPGTAKSIGDLLSLAAGKTAGASAQAVIAAKQLLELYGQQGITREEIAQTEKDIAAQTEKIRIEQEKIATIEKQQADLKFLQQQLDFLDFIEERGLDAASILEGFEFGLNADLGQLLQAMSGAMQQVIEAAESQLQIASPSKVFENIAKLTLGGFIRGTKDQTSNAINSMTDFTRGIVSSVTGGLGSITNNNQRNRTIEVNLSNNFANQPQVTDRSQLELLLASYV